MSLFSTKAKGLHIVNVSLLLVFCKSNDLNVINFILNKIIKVVEKIEKSVSMNMHIEYKDIILLE